MPVRIKQRARYGISLSTNNEWDRLQKRLTALALAWQKPVKICLCNDSEAVNLVIDSGKARHWPDNHLNPKDISLALKLLTGAGMINAGSWPSWVPVSAVALGWKVSGAISLDPAPTKDIQFISFNKEPISASHGHNEYYEHINRIFGSSRFGLTDKETIVGDIERDRRQKDRRYKRDGFARSRLTGRRRGVDRWPMFWLKIECRRSEEENVVGRLTSRRDPTFVDKITSMLTVVITQWLTQYNMSPKKIRKLDSRVQLWANRPDSAYQQRLLAEQPPRDSEYFRPSQDSTTKFQRGSESRESDDKINPARNKVSASGTNARSVLALSSFSKMKSARPIKLNDCTFDLRISSDGLGRKAVKRAKALNQSKDTLSVGPEVIDERKQRIESPNINTGNTAKDLLRDHQASASPGREHQTGIDTSEIMRCTEEENVSWRDGESTRDYVVNIRSGIIRPRPPKLKVHGAETVHGTPHLRLEKFNSVGVLKESEESKPQDSRHSEWIQKILKNWDNPVYGPRREQIDHMLPEEPAGSGKHRTCPSHSWVTNSRPHVVRLAGIKQWDGTDLDLAALEEAEVISQLDRKFVLVRMPMRTRDSSSTFSSTSGSKLAVVDQHAADERCKVERLLDELCAIQEPQQCCLRTNLGQRSMTASVILQKPVEFRVFGKDSTLFKRHARFFARWGILYDVHSDTASGCGHAPSEARVTVQSLPPSIIERCTVDHKLLIELLRSEVWKRSDMISELQPPAQEETRCEKHPWLRRLKDCPIGVLDLVNSRACRSAIMFNDVVTREESEDLVHRLARCAFPLQCAHGRPSMVPLVEIWDGSGSKNIGMGRQQEDQDSSRRSLVPAVREWLSRGA